MTFEFNAEDPRIANTRDLIEFAGTEISIERPTAASRIDDGMGGVIYIDAPLEIFPPKRRWVQGVAIAVEGAGYEGAPVTTFDEDGQEQLTAYVIVGMPDDDLRRDDQFMYRGNRVRIVSVLPDKGWQCRAVGHLKDSGG